MAKLSDLVSRTSEVTGILVATVREVGRRLREAGLITTGRGGRYGGADMTPSDAACLLAALLIVRATSVPLTDIVQVTKTYLRGLTSHSPHGHRMVLDRWDPRLALPELCRLKWGHTLEDALTALIASFSNQDFERRMSKWNGANLIVKIGCPRPVGSHTPQPEAKIEFRTGRFGDLDLFYIRRRSAERLEAVMPKKWSDIPEVVEFEMYVGAEVSESTLKCIGLLLRNSETKHA
jgi:hypothetical protein